MTNAILDLPGQTDVHWFAGANTRYGFIGLYDTIFRAGEFESVYVIHGAPGTGKSHMMKTVAQRLPQVACERLYCSSDPSSLDGLILHHEGRTVGLLDGTAPHSRSISLPGTVETMIDLGAFWNRYGLKNERSEILAQTGRKKAAYESAYAALTLAGYVAAEQARTLQHVFLREKAESFSIRLLKKVAPKKGAQRIRYLSAFGMTGPVSHAANLSFCKRVWRIPTYYGIERLCLDVIAKQAAESGVEHIRFPDVLDPFYTEALLFPKEECAVLLGDESITKEDSIITPMRFVNCDALRSVRQRLRSLSRMLEEEKKTAVNELSRAGEAHFALERIFANAMNFSAKEAFTEETVESIRKDLFRKQ